MQAEELEESEDNVNEPENEAVSAARGEVGGSDDVRGSDFTNGDREGRDRDRAARNKPIRVYGRSKRFTTQTDSQYQIKIYTLRSLTDSSDDNGPSAQTQNEGEMDVDEDRAGSMIGEGDSGSIKDGDVGKMSRDGDDNDGLYDSYADTSGISNRKDDGDVDRNSEGGDGLDDAVDGYGRDFRDDLDNSGSFASRKGGARGGDDNSGEFIGI